MNVTDEVSYLYSRPDVGSPRLALFCVSLPAPESASFFAGKPSAPAASAAAGGRVNRAVPRYTGRVREAGPGDACCAIQTCSCPWES